MQLKKLNKDIEYAQREFKETVKNNEVENK
jgi:hypothetical protein